MKFLPRTIHTWHWYVAVNVQIGLSGSILPGFIKLEDQICKLNYRGAKSLIGDKLIDKKYNFINDILFIYMGDVNFQNTMCVFVDMYFF